jgi:hypothetical protein
MKLHDIIVQSVHNETPWYYGIECLQWNSTILLYTMSTMKLHDIMEQDIYNETPWIWRWFKNEQVFQVLRSSYTLQEFKFPPIFIGYLTSDRWDASTVIM